MMAIIKYDTDNNFKSNRDQLWQNLLRGALCDHLMQRMTRRYHRENVLISFAYSVENGRNVRIGE
jgi:hypothetical protein